MRPLSIILVLPESNVLFADPIFGITDDQAAREAVIIRDLSPDQLEQSWDVYSIGGNFIGMYHSPNGWQPK